MGDRIEKARCGLSAFFGPSDRSDRNVVKVRTTWRQRSREISQLRPVQRLQYKQWIPEDAILRGN